MGQAPNKRDREEEKRQRKKVLHRLVQSIFGLTYAREQEEIKWKFSQVHHSRVHLKNSPKYMTWNTLSSVHLKVIANFASVAIWPQVFVATSCTHTCTIAHAERERDGASKKKKMSS